MLVMSFHYLINEKAGIMMSKEVSEFLWYQLLFKGHVLCGLIAIFIGPIQFYALHKSERFNKHRVRGYIYACSIGISGFCGLIIAQYSMGGTVTTIGFSTLSVLWLYTTFYAIWAAIKRKIELHKFFINMSYALTFAAITQRTLLLIPLLSTVPFMPIYKLSAWLPWIFNLIIVYFFTLKYQQQL